MVEGTKEPWLPNWRPKLRAWLEELLDFVFIFAGVIMLHTAFRLGRTAFGLDADLMNFMERSDQFAVKTIWVMFLLSQVRRATATTLSQAPATQSMSRPSKKKQNGG